MTNKQKVEVERPSPPLLRLRGGEGRRHGALMENQRAINSSEKEEEEEEEEESATLTPQNNFNEKPAIW
ncbi:hypothetical protein NQZ68_011131, partial [Dissostichus eleginoides]